MFDNQMPNVSANNTGQRQGSGYNTNSPWNDNFSGQLNNMLAPDPQTASIMQRLQNPYATMNQNSWLAKNHPQVAGMLDNAFLTMGMTPGPQGPEGAGGGISRTMQGLMGAQQFHRQRMLEGAMLPYQMMGPRLQMMDTMSQINERNAMVPFRMAQERRYDAQSDMYYNRMAQGDRAKAMAGPDITDDKGGTWSRVFDPISGQTRLFNPVMQKHADELPADQQPQFTKEQRSQRMSTPGGLAGEIIDMRMSADPAVQQRGEQMSQMYAGLMGGVAGARAGADQAVTQPVRDTATFLKNERTAAYNTIPKLQSASDYQTSRLTDADYWKDPQKAYENYNKQYQATKQQMDVDLSKYEKSSAPTKGVSFSEYMQDRTKWDGSAPNPAPASTPSSGGTNAVNRNWHY